MKYPIITSIGFNTYLLGSYMYLVGYADMSLDVKNARYKKGGFLKPLGMLTVLGCAIATGVSILRN